MRYNEINPNSKLRRLLPPLTRSLSLSEGGFFVSSIITQIGRENKFSADFYVCIKDRRGRRSLQIVIFLMRRSVMRTVFVLSRVDRKAGIKTDLCFPLRMLRRDCGSLFT